jgi:hypothetical protein
LLVISYGFLLVTEQKEYSECHHENFRCQRNLASGICAGLDTNMKIAVSWIMIPHNLVECHQCFGITNQKAAIITV